MSEREDAGLILSRTRHAPGFSFKLIYEGIKMFRIARLVGRIARREGVPPWSHIFLAALLATVGIIILPGSQPTEEARRAVGGALLAAGLVGLLYDHLFVRRVIGRYFDLLKTAASLELEEIYTSRGEALKAIASELEKAGGNVKISCISGSDFFRDGPAANAITQLVEGKRNVHLRFLLQNQHSRYSYLRAWLEEKYDCARENQPGLDEGELVPKYTRAEFKESTMQGRMDAARLGLLNVSRTLSPPTRLTVRHSKYPPSLFLVAVNRWLFVEFYHWGVDPDYRAGVAPCIGKRVFVLRFRRESFNGTILENHFDRLWRCSRTTRFLPAEQSVPRKLVASA